MPIEPKRLQELIDERLAISKKAIKKGLPRKLKLVVNQDNRVEAYAFGMFYQTFDFDAPALTAYAVDLWITKIVKRIQQDIAKAIYQPKRNIQ